MTLRFGTDGVRGVANVELTSELVTALGRAAARVLGIDEPFVVGRDTRRSGPMLEAALVAGLCAEGADVVLVVADELWLVVAIPTYALVPRAIVSLPRLVQLVPLAETYAVTRVPPERGGPIAEPGRRPRGVRRMPAVLRAALKGETLPGRHQGKRMS